MMKKHSAKNFIIKATSALAVSAFLCMSVSAEISHTVDYDYVNNTVTVSGKCEENAKYIGLQILSEGKDFDEVKEKPTDSSLILYRYQKDAENGAFSFTVKYGDVKADEYNAKIAGDNADSAADFKLRLVTGTEYSSAVENLKKLADSGDYAAFNEFIGQNGRSLGFDLGLYGKLSSSDALKTYMAYVASSELSSDNCSRITGDFNAFVLMAALGESKVDNIKPYIGDTSISQCDAANDFMTLAEDEVQQKYVTAKMSGKQLKSKTDLENALKEALMLNEVRYAEGFDGVKKIFAKYGSLIGVDANASSSVYKQLCGIDFVDGGKLAEKYKALKNSSDSDGGSSGGGGGGGSSSTKVSPVTVGSTVGGSTYKPTGFQIEFTDIDGVEWASEAILALADKGIINGKSEKLFKPNDAVTREEIAKILVCALGFDNTTASGNVFADVSESDWFCRYVNTAYEKGILQGVGNGNFGSGAAVTRQDLMVMLANAFKLKGIQIKSGELTFADGAVIADYAKDAVSALCAMGIVNGVSDTQFDPLGTATRAQAAKVVYGFLQYAE